jgi:hypothetical protein
LTQGTLLSTPLITVPTLLSLPNSQTASKAYDQTLQNLHRLTTSLSVLSVIAYTATLLFARKKHPYLAYAGVLSAVGGGWIVRGRVRRREVDGFEVLEEENAEVVRERILGLRDWVGLGICAVGFVVSVVGGYGEGFSD